MTRPGYSYRAVGADFKQRRWRSGRRFEMKTAMYTVSVQRRFTAYHYLIGGDWGAENQLHPHPYRVEVQLHGPALDEHGYLVDIVEIERRLDSLIAAYRDQTLNDQPAFAGRNPSLEHFARILAEALWPQLPRQRLTHLTVVVWENEEAWASYQLSQA